MSWVVWMGNSGPFQRGGHCPPSLFTIGGILGKNADSRLCNCLKTMNYIKSITFEFRERLNLKQKGGLVNGCGDGRERV